MRRVFFWVYSLESPSISLASQAIRTLQRFIISFLYLSVGIKNSSGIQKHDEYCHHLKGYEARRLLEMLGLEEVRNAAGAVKISRLFDVADDLRYATDKNAGM